jgi:predicted RNA methylase
VHTGELFWRGLREEAQELGWLRALTSLTARLAGVLRDSLPDRRRMRYGDIQYDLEHNVNTTWANVGFLTRLREALIGATYQTTDPVIFTEAMEMLKGRSDFQVPPFGGNCEFEQFTFIDLGSGKGRVLLMAAEYPFRRIIGVELLPELQQVARENLRRAAQLESRFELICGDARELEFADEPLVVFLFNPFPARVVRTVMRNLQASLQASPRPVFIVFHNALHEAEFAAAPALKRLGGTHQFVVYGNFEFQISNVD